MATIVYPRGFIIDYMRCRYHSGASFRPNMSIASLGPDVRPNAGPTRSGQPQKVRMPYQRTHELFKREAFSDDSIIKNIRSILGKISPQTTDKLTVSLLGIKYPANPEFREQFVALYHTVVMECIHWVDMYMELYKNLREKDAEFATAFGKLIIDKLSQPDSFPNEVKTKKFITSNFHVTIRLYLDKQFSDEIIKSAFATMLEADVYKEKFLGIEIICNGLTECGRNLERRSSKLVKDLIKDFKKMSEDKDTYPSRIRFMLMDLIDLHKNHWNKKSQINPKEKKKDTRSAK